ncbi:Uncharacterised protein [Shigella sonnei]|nr:Uncharacterised protein [Shigella sonnei]CSR87689.1 Uncharacterised protein [Shigella sonnei]
MIEAIAYQVGQRVDNAFYQAFVEFSRTAHQRQFYLLAEFSRQITHQPGIATKNIFHRHHANRHH